MFVCQPDCVINLAAAKQSCVPRNRADTEAGRSSGSHRCRTQAITARRMGDMMACVGCVAGAMPIADYREGLLEAGFQQLKLLTRGLTWMRMPGSTTIRLLFAYVSTKAHRHQGPSRLQLQRAV